MWDRRFDDLWLFPMPAWFVRLANRTIGPHALEWILASEIVGLSLVLLATANDRFWFRIAGYVLIAPGPLLIAGMVATAQRAKHRQRRTDRHR